jgi:hypothetical protein
MNRRCGRCEQVKSVEEFAWRRQDRDQRDNYCRPCRAAYKQEHYALNRARYIRSAQERKRAVVAERVAYLLDFFRSHPCVDCGEDDPLVLEFDHLGEKEFNISKGIRDRGWDAVLAEMAKCDVVCANCHRRRTGQRGGFARVMAWADPGSGD